MENKNKAQQCLLDMFATIGELTNALNDSSTVSAFQARKQQMYLLSSPAVEDLADIYHIGDAPIQFVSMCIRYVYALKENQMPSEQIKNYMAGSFLAQCHSKTVNQVLCFVSEYPSIKQYSTRFDFTTLSQSFATFCNAWDEERNKMLDAQYKAEQTAAQSTAGKVVGMAALVEHLRTINARGIDIRQSALYNGKYADKDYVRLAEKIIQENPVTPDYVATDKYYGWSEHNEQVSINRRHLPDMFLTPEERAQRKIQTA